jgi:hypothetical protein
MEKNKTAASDGFPIEFFQVGWGFMKNDIMELFNDFHKGTLRLNYGIITLLPKLKEAYKIQQFRLICLLNCIYKLFTKVLTLRLEPVASRIIHLYQSAFIAGRNIKENIIALHLVLHETKKRRMEIGAILKLDFKKTYDKVHWGFLLNCLRTRGFNERWCIWIKIVLQEGNCGSRD